MSGIGTNASPIAVDAAGNNNSPVINEDFIRGLIIAGQGFNICMPNIGAGLSVAGIYGMEIFFPTGASLKNLFVYSLSVVSGAGNPVVMQYTTSETAYGNNCNINNMNLGSSGTSVLAGHATYATAAVTPGGSNILHTLDVSTPGNMEFFTNGAGLLLPANYGLTITCSLGTYNTFGMTLRCVQF